MGRYLVLVGLGRSYKAVNITLNRPQAIKVIHDQYLSDPQFRTRFDHEAHILGSLNHPNVLHVDDYETQDNRTYLVMPYISGGTLKTILDQTTKLSIKQVGIYLRQISAALDYAHAHDVIHLDLKPQNLLHHNGTLFLADFGLAHLVNDGVILGGESLRFGSPHYMAPEHIQGAPQRSSDIYALGVILFQMLTNRLPFDGANYQAIINFHLKEAPPSPGGTRPDIPSIIDNVINRAMAKNPRDRYSTAGALFNDFKRKIGLPLDELLIPEITSDRVLEGSSPLTDNSRTIPPLSSQNTISGSSRLDTSHDFFEHSIPPYTKIRLDIAPPLDIINHVLQKVGKQIQLRRQNES